MEYVLLCVAALGVTLQNVMSKLFNEKVKRKNAYFYAAVCAFSSMLFFVVSSGGTFHFVKELLPYSAAFGLTYGASLFSSLKAMQYGPMSITALIVSLALIIPTLFGIFVLGDTMNMCKYSGIVFLVLALLLINAQKEKEAKISHKWVLLAVITFISNGLIAIVQKVQQMVFDGGYKSEFMIIAFAIVVVFFLLLGLAEKESKREKLVTCIKYAAPAGIANGLANFLVMVLTALVPTVVLFPSISAVGMAVTFILSLTVFKEKLSKAQIFGYMAGILSVILLNM